MARNRKILLVGGSIVWALLVVWALLFILFPYLKTLKTVFEDFVGGGSTRISFVNAKKGFACAGASKIIVGHEAIEGKPFYVLEKVGLTWNALSILRGVCDVTVHASMYGGKVDFKVTDLPVVAGNMARLNIEISKLGLGGYPEGTVPWFKSISGVMTGTVKKEIRLLAREQEKGSFSFKIRDGEVKAIPLKNEAELSFPFREIAIEGKIKGERWDIEKVAIAGSTVTINGSGIILDRGTERVTDVKLTYESTGQGGPFMGKGTIVVTGSVWSPEVVMVKEAGAQSVADFEKSPFFRKYKVRDKKSTPLKPAGTSFAYTYPDGEDKNGEIEVVLAPDPHAIERISVSWRGKAPSGAPEFTEGRQQFFTDLLGFYDAAMEPDELIGFIESHQADKYPGGEGAMKKEKIEKVLIRAGVIGNALVVGVERAK
jgi:hypothetical protein